MGARKKAVAVETDEAKLERLIQEHSVIKDRIDALEEMKSSVKSQILLLMRDKGLSRFKSVAGDAAFQVRRSFSVIDVRRLSEMFSPVQLASLVNITADVYDAALAEDKPLDEAITVGRSEGLSVSRARGKAATEMRKQHIEESKRQAQARIMTLRETFQS